MKLGQVGLYYFPVIGTDFHGRPVEVPAGNSWMVVDLVYEGPEEARWAVVLLDEEGRDPRGVSYEGAWAGFLHQDKVEEDVRLATQKLLNRAREGSFEEGIDWAEDDWASSTEGEVSFVEMTNAMVSEMAEDEDELAEVSSFGEAMDQWRRYFRDQPRDGQMAGQTCWSLIHHGRWAEAWEILTICYQRGKFRWSD